MLAFSCEQEDPYYSLILLLYYSLILLLSYSFFPYSSLTLLLYHLSVLSSLIPYAFAQTTLVPTGSAYNCNLGEVFRTGDFTWSCIASYVYYLINFVLGFTIAFALLMLMYNGYRYVLGPLSGEGTNEGAKKGIMYALMGTAVGLLAYIIVDSILVALSS